MISKLHFHAIVFLALLGSCCHANARNQWTVCNVEIAVDKVMRPEHKLAVHVTRSIGKNPISCPGPDTELAFTPETPDYQRTLPKRFWPRVGTKARLQYRYLDGICKERGPCRIEHYAIVSKADST